MILRSAFATLLLFPVVSLTANAAEVAVLNESNWDRLVPKGKEVDAIYGDHVLKNNEIVVVIANAAPTRNANLTVKRVGGSVLDLTRLDAMSDQLSCYYPHGGGYTIEGPITWPAKLPRTAGAVGLAFKLTWPDANDANERPDWVVGYELADGANDLTVRSLARNTTGQPITVELADGVRADGEFEFGVNGSLNVWWACDADWAQAYGIAPTTAGYTAKMGEARRRRPRQIVYEADQPTTLGAGEAMVFERRIYPAANGFEVLRHVADQRKRETTAVTVVVQSDLRPVADALVKAVSGEEVIALGRTDEAGRLRAELPVAEYRFVVESLRRKADQIVPGLQAGDEYELELNLPATGRVAGMVTNGEGEAIPARIAFYGQGVADPYWGPEAAVHGVKNLWHTHDGAFDVEMLPGKYQMVISYGPEHDAVIKEITVTAGKTTRVAERLPRVVDTTGWLSAELHSHSSPSGDNTASQRGRVLNLLVDHLEFIPCTEHQRIDTYEPDLLHFGAMDRVLTCTGMELTGRPLPINHQNVFPLRHKPRTQDGGGPVIDIDPEVQIERIALWDDGADKVVQINHPNVGQMAGDRDEDGTPDRGFRKMFHYADVMEVHPHGLIFGESDAARGAWDGPGNAILGWMQLLNQGYRVPGVVNTDAHYNYYGSGWLRTYVKSATDIPAEANLMDICHAIERGNTVMTNGPFMEVTVGGSGKTVGPGGDLVGDRATVSVKVQCPNWLDVNRVQLFVNGRPAPNYNFLRSSSDKFGDGVVKFEHTFDVPIEEDAHLIVATAAEGRELGIVYGPQQGKTMPAAVSNPVFIDVKGDGWKPNRDKLDTPLPLERDHTPTHGHDPVRSTVGG
ncbi:MAG: CehA/McbA family metallohydrolase [Planctomycetota bacterium]